MNFLFCSFSVCVRVQVSAFELQISKKLQLKITKAKHKHVIYMLSISRALCVSDYVTKVERNSQQNKTKA